MDELTIFPDATDADADWIKKTWDLPTDPVYLLNYCKGMSDNYDRMKANVSRVLAKPNIPEATRIGLVEAFNKEKPPGVQTKTMFTAPRERIQHDPMVKRPRRRSLTRRASAIAKRKPRKQEMKGLEVKTRILHVATAAGVERYDQPMGSIIIAGTGKVLPHLSYSHDQPFKSEGFTRVDDDNGNQYDIGPDHDNGWYVATGVPGEWDDIVVDEAKDEAEAARLLDTAVGKPRNPNAKAIKGTARQAAATAAKKKPPPVVTPKPKAKVPLAKRASAVAGKPRAKAKKASTPTGRDSVPKILARSGGNLTLADKDGKELSGTLNPTPPLGGQKKSFVAIKKTPKVSRRNPKDYQMLKGNMPIQTEALRIQGALRAGGTQSAIDRAHKQGKEFRLADARDNEHLWFPKDPKSVVAYSYRQAKPKLDKNGNQIKDKNGNRVFLKQYFDRKTQYTKEYMDKNRNNNHAKAIMLQERVYKLDAALKKDAMKNDDAASVALMRVLGIRPNTQDEEAQEKNLVNKSPLKARALRAQGIDPTQPIYGATSLQARHVTIDGDKVKIEFMGKEHVWNTHVTNDEVIRNMLKVRLKNKAAQDALFPDTDDDTTQAYIQKHMGVGVDNKDLRTLLATQLAAQLIAQRPAPKNEQDYERARAEIAAQVALTLNNKGKQVLDSYIAAPIWDTWKKGIK